MKTDLFCRLLRLKSFFVDVFSLEVVSVKKNVVKMSFHFDSIQLLGKQQRKLVLSIQIMAINHSINIFLTFKQGFLIKKSSDLFIFIDTFHLIYSDGMIMMFIVMLTMLFIMNGSI